MERSEIKFSDLTNDQIEEIKALESKLNTHHTKDQETVLIAYAQANR